MSLGRPTFKIRKYDATVAQDAAPPAYNEAEDMVEVKKIEEVAVAESSETPEKKKKKTVDGGDDAAQVESSITIVCAHFFDVISRIMAGWVCLSLMSEHREDV